MMILVAWEIWKHHCLFNREVPAIVLRLVSEECMVWCTAGAKHLQVPMAVQYFTIVFMWQPGRSFLHLDSGILVLEQWRCECWVWVCHGPSSSLPLMKWHTALLHVQEGKTNQASKNGELILQHPCHKGCVKVIGDRGSPWRNLHPNLPFP